MADFTSAWEGEGNPVFWLATWAGKVGWSCPLRISLFWPYNHLCEFAKGCPLTFRLNTGVQASVAGKKPGGLAILLGVSREPRPTPIRGWVANLFCVKTRGVGRGVLSLWLEFQVRKQSCKIKEFFLLASPAKSLLWFIIITLLAELGGSDWLVISVMGGEAECLLLGLGCLETKYRHLLWNSHRHVNPLFTKPFRSRWLFLHCYWPLTSSRSLTQKRNLAVITHLDLTLGQ